VVSHLDKLKPFRLKYRYYCSVGRLRKALRIGALKLEGTLLISVHGHVFLLLGDGRIACDTDYIRKSDRRPVTGLYVIKKKPWNITLTPMRNTGGKLDSKKIKEWKIAMAKKIKSRIRLTPV
jgi:hypothetical protein